MLERGILENGRIYNEDIGKFVMFYNKIAKEDGEIIADTNLYVNSHNEHLSDELVIQLTECFYDDDEIKSIMIILTKEDKQILRELLKDD